MLLVALFLFLTLNTYAQTPFEVWENVKATENVPVTYDEIVVTTEAQGVSVRYFNVFRKNASTIRREETGYYGDEVLQVELKIDYTDYLWMENIPYVYKSLASDQLVSWVPTQVSKNTFDGIDVLILTLVAESVPYQARQFISAANMTVFREELYRSGHLVQVRDRRNIRLNPQFEEGTFDVPEGFVVLSDRKAWEKALVSEMLRKSNIQEVYYPEWLPPQWVLIDVNIDEHLDDLFVVYRYSDGSEFYSLFVSPYKGSPKRSRLSVTFQDNMRVYQLVQDDRIMTLVGRLSERDALKVLESLVELNSTVE